MKINSINTETTIEVELTAQDVDAYIKTNKLIPPDWKFYSTNITGCGISQGAKLTIKQTKSEKPN